MTWPLAPPGCAAAGAARRQSTRGPRRPISAANGVDKLGGPGLAPRAEFLAAFAPALTLFFAVRHRRQLAGMDALHPRHSTPHPAPGRNLTPTPTRELAHTLHALEEELKQRLDLHEAAIVNVLQRIMEILDPPPPSPDPPKPAIGFLSAKA
jgi:hypothetical protein